MYDMLTKKTSVHTNYTKFITDRREKIARPSGPKTRCNNQWTESRYRSFITSTLRSATKRWAPKTECKKQARVRRGEYKCASCGTIGPASVRIDGKKFDNAVVDHIVPVVDPAVGFTTWDEYIERMFCEMDNLQVLCHECHQAKSDEERRIATERRRKEKELEV